MNQFFARPTAKLLLIATLLFSMVSGQALAQILSYTNDSAGALSSVATNASGTPIVRVNGATSPLPACSSGFSATSFASTTFYSSALAGTEVTVAPNSGYYLNIAGFSAALRRSAAGPAQVRFAYSIDGGATWTDQGSDQYPNNGACGVTTTGNWTTTVIVAYPSNIKFRLYGYAATSASGNLQVMNLNVLGDVIPIAAGCGIPSGLSATSITSSSALLAWTAVTGAISYNIQYRPVGTTVWNTTSSATNTVTIAGLLSGASYEFQVQSVCSAIYSSIFTSSAAFSTLSTASASSGTIKAYFNNPVDNSVSTTGTNAVYLSNSMADTIVAYINRAKYSVDIAQYDYNQSSSYADISVAVNNAYAAGKKVRWIYDGSQANTGLALLNPGIHTLASPTSSAYGIMHNKFVLIDANSSDPNDAIVSTGSEDWGVTQLNTCNNNILFIQDSALAKAYLKEFNMMWGDTSATPNSALAKFGPDKTDLGQHLFTIGGKTVELYFSPSDNTDAHILSSINSADFDLSFGVYDFTMTGDANAVVARQTTGVYTAGIVDQYSNTGAAYPLLTAGLGAMLRTYAATGSVVYHNKMLIVDHSNSCSDPLVLTGSHNWTASANTKNDENTLIIHSDTISDVYFQAFHADFVVLGGALTSLPPCSATTCGTATNLPATGISTASAVLNWTAVTGASSYVLEYRVTGTTSWTAVTTTSNIYSLSGLSPNTTYDFQVQAICSSTSTGAFSATTTFTTLPVGCGTPTTLGISAVTHNTATVTWSAVPGATGYNIRYRQAGVIAWSSTTSSTNSVTLTLLIAGTTYEFEVEAICTSVGSYSASAAFTTESALNVSQESAGNSIIISPNPTDGQVAITYNLANDQIVTMNVTNVLGQQVMNIVSNEAQTAGQHRAEVTLSTPGIYFVKFTSGGQTYTKKLVRY